MKEIMFLDVRALGIILSTANLWEVILILGVFLLAAFILYKNRINK